MGTEYFNESNMTVIQYTKVLPSKNLSKVMDASSSPLVPWISPRPQRRHFWLWVEGVGGAGHQEAWDPA